MAISTTPISPKNIFSLRKKYSRSIPHQNTFVSTLGENTGRHVFIFWHFGIYKTNHFLKCAMLTKKRAAMFCGSDRELSFDVLLWSNYVESSYVLIYF